MLSRLSLSDSDDETMSDEENTATPRNGENGECLTLSPELAELIKKQKKAFGPMIQQ